ncbi:MAG: DUF4870 domain-containing protein [Pirellulales bacterium]
MNLTDELQKLQQLHQSGALSDEEFAQAKAALFDRRDLTAHDPAALARETNQWAMFLHLSLLAGFIIPFAGLVAPIVIWQLKKTELPEIDIHGKIVVNWIISAFIYAILCVILIFLIVGVPLLIALGILGVVFPIIGGLKASAGEVWRYPLSIDFLK